jgi:hypothetical protein
MLQIRGINVRYTVDLPISVNENIVMELRGKLSIWHDTIECPIDTLGNLTMHNTVIDFG